MNHNINSIYPDVTTLITSLGKEAVHEAKNERTMKLPIASPHEGFAGLEQRMDTLKEQVWKRPGARDLTIMRFDAVQLAAQALRFAAEVCSEERGRR